MFELIPYLKSNLMKADNRVHSGRSSEKDSRVYVFNQIKNKEKLLCVTGIFLLLIIYSCVCICVHLYCKQTCHIKLSNNMQYAKVAISTDLLVFRQMIMNEKICIDLCKV